MRNSKDVLESLQNKLDFRYGLLQKERECWMQQQTRHFHFTQISRGLNHRFYAEKSVIQSA
jgi:hypothetical protein